jgi:hypothetical protein
MDYCLLRSTYFPFAALLQYCNIAILQYCNIAILQCCNVAMHRSNLLIHSRKVASKVPALISPEIFGLPKEVHLQTRIAVLGLEAVFEMPKQETRKIRRSELRRVRWRRYNSQEIAIAKRPCHFCCAWPCPALPACMTNLLSPLSTSSNDLNENISDIVGGWEHLSFWHGMARHRQLGIHGDSKRASAPISGSESSASPDRGPHLSSGISIIS